MTVSQVKAIFTRLLHKRPPTSAAIAEEVSGVLRSNKNAWIYHWYAQTKTFPPRRSRLGFSCVQQ